MGLSCFYLRFSFGILILSAFLTQPQLAIAQDQTCPPPTSGAECTVANVGFSGPLFGVGNTGELNSQGVIEEAISVECSLTGDIAPGVTVETFPAGAVDLFQLQGPSCDVVGKLSTSGRFSFTWTTIFHFPTAPDETFVQTVILIVKGGCQVSPPVARLGQCDGKPGPWGGDLYAFDCTDRKTICALGCALTSLSMDLTWAGVFDVSDFTLFAPCQPFPTPTVGSLVPQNPHYLNLLMARHTFLGDYRGLDHVNPDVTTRDVSALTGKSLFFSNDFAGAEDDDDALDAALCSGGKGGTPQPVVVGVTSQCSGRFPGHYVLVTGETIEADGTRHFEIADPIGTGKCKSGHPVATCDSLDCYNNHFLIWGSVTDPPSDLSGFDLYVGDPADLTLIDATSQRTGVDPLTGAVLRQIPRASYFSGSIDDDETGDLEPRFHLVQAFRPHPGPYTVVVTGVAPGQYELGFNAYSQDGAAQSAVSIPGIADVGSSSSFQIQFDSTPGAKPQVVRVATFDGTGRDIGTAAKLGLIKGDRTEDHLSDEIKDAAAEASEGDERGAREHLWEFKEEVRRGTPRRIDPLTAQVLLDDADSLLKQLHGAEKDDDDSHR